jgi:hypothetical protein
MQDLDTCVTWKGRRVWVSAKGVDGSRQEGDIVKADASFMVREDVDLAIRLADGRVEMVLASERGVRWGFV